MLAFLTTTVGCFCVVGGWVTRSKQTQYSLLSTGIIIIPFLKKESKPYLKPSARRVHNIPRYISSLSWFILNDPKRRFKSLYIPHFVGSSPFPHGWNEHFWVSGYHRLLPPSRLEVLVTVLSTTGLQALAHDPLGGENLRKMGIETAITIIAITCYNCIVLSSYLLISCSY